MRIDAQKIRNGLIHFKQMMTHSGLSAHPNVNRNSFGTSMENPLGHGPMPPNSSGGGQNRNAQVGNGGLLSPYQLSPVPNVVPRSPYQASPVPQVPAQTNFYGRSPGNQSNHANLAPLIQDHGSASISFYANEGKAEIVNNAPPLTMLTGLKQTQTDFYCNQTDFQINQQLDKEAEEATQGNSNGKAEMLNGPLAIQKDLQLYEDFLRLEEYQTRMPKSSPGLKNLANGDYLLERDSPWHKSAHLLELLIMYYKQKKETLYPPITFSRFITSVTVKDLQDIWKVPNDSQAQEFLRRFIQGVRYLTPEKAAKYNVYTYGNKGALHWAKWGNSNPLDTTSSEFFKRKHEGETLTPDRIAIWVISKEEKLYTHPGKIHRFHHSSFTSGDQISCAGDWEVKNGKIVWISARSGHYMPGFEYLLNAVKILANKFGISANSYDIKVFEPKSKGTKEVFFKASRLLYDFKSISEKYALS